MPLNDIWLMVVLFLFGVVLMVIELIIPGFGIPGIAGILSLIAGIVVGSSVLLPWQLAIAIFLVFIITIIMVVLLYRSAIKNGRMFRWLFLQSRATKEEGYSSNKDLNEIVGKVGISTTILRPSGTADFDGEKIDVIADGQFISKGEKVKILRVEGFRVLVERIYDNTEDKF